MDSFIKKVPRSPITPEEKTKKIVIKNPAKKVPDIQRINRKIVHATILWRSKVWYG